MKVNKVAIIGLGHFGASLCEKLSEAGIEILAVDADEDRVRAVEPFSAHPVVLDGRDKQGLANLGLQDMDVVIVAIGEDFESSVLTTAHCQELGVKRLISRTMNPVQERVISLMGIKEQILPERDSAFNLAYRLGLGTCLSFIDMGDGYGFFEVEVPEIFVDKSLADIKLREEHQLNLVTLKRPDASGDAKVIGVPVVDAPLREGDILVLFGHGKDIKKLM
ncbi:potassium channel family protein [Pseudobacteriovorax antillogorgiicola]|uniref:Trk system potassium uptake protein TrkA n=1 Tax=Pseudobacteriovorax antillogorgiicola TaxID=1513793 RepID=A0A1Y6B9W9_9BACT|nr:TrkA family potassium uptake protein [Pseudobacteriovorax antillogorgiicola]TCS57466.1 trk system potassium uptake protein TrkA [Pseudobacteriovorax antillogorgiicola]SMF00720.1 trk system potassium uptake protein TrkA [Pseudobacteriovorax antillogorgiicola]